MPVCDRGYIRSRVFWCIISSLGGLILLIGSAKLIIFEQDLGIVITTVFFYGLIGFCAVLGPVMDGLYYRKKIRGVH